MKPWQLRPRSVATKMAVLKGQMAIIPKRPVVKIGPRSGAILLPS